MAFFDSDLNESNFGPSKPKNKGFRGYRTDSFFKEPTEPNMQINLKNYSVSSPAFPRGPKYFGPDGAPQPEQQSGL